MKYGVIVRADGGVSLFPWISAADVADVFARWQESARPEWLPATLEETEQDITAVEFAFHRSRASDNALEWDGTKVVVNMDSASRVYVSRIEAAKRLAARAMIEREFLGENATAKKEKLRSINALELVNGAQTPAALLTRWPAALDEFKL